MKDWSMFRELVQYNDAVYGRQYPCFYIYTEEGRVKYNIFSVYITDGNNVIMAVGSPDNDEKENFINSVKKKSLYSLDAEVSAQDNIISLITCDVKDDSKRVVVNAVKVVNYSQ